MTRAFRFVQARLADLRADEPTLLPPPESHFLVDPGAPAGASPHTIDPTVLRGAGIRLESRYTLARDTRGAPHLWMQRRTIPKQNVSGQQLRFDITRPDTSDRSARPKPELMVAISDVNARREGSGRHRVEATVEISNEGDVWTERSVVSLQAGELASWDFTTHFPVPIESIAPGETVTAIVESIVLDASGANLVQVRVVVVPCPGSAVSSCFGLSDVELDSAVTEAGVSVLAASGVVEDGTRRSMQLTIEVPGAADALEAVVQIRAGDRWQPAPIWQINSGNENQASGEVSWNADQFAPPVEIRAMAFSSTGDLLFAPAQVIAPGEARLPATPVLNAVLTIHDSRSDGENHQVLAVVTVENGGEIDLDDLELQFEQRLPTNSQWQTVPHQQRASHFAIAPGGRIAIPVLVETEAVDSLLILLRCRVLSDATAIVAKAETWTVLVDER